MGELVDVGDVTLFVRELGRRSARPSVVVMHGGPDVGHGYLVPGFEPLARDHHVVLFDFRGCGRSSRGLPEDALQPEYVVRDTSRLIERLGLGVVDLVGFSTGGRAAMQFVDTHPEQVRRLVLASTSAYRLADAAPYLADWPEYQRRQRIDDEANGALRNSTVFVWDLDRARSRPQRTASSPQRGPHVPLRTTRDLVRPHPPVPRRLTLGSSVECQSVEEVVLMRRSCAVPPRNHRRL